MTQFYEQLIGLKRGDTEDGVRLYSLPNGDQIELFSETDNEHRFFATGPVPGFLVDDIDRARRTLQ